MLGDHPLDVVLLAKDLDAACDFYANKVGLELIERDEHRLVFKCAGESRLAISKSTTGTADEQTQASWRVDDVAAEVAELRSRGVKIEDYDGPGLKTVDGVADIGFALAAWFVDPGKNALGILQPK